MDFWSLLYTASIPVLEILIVTALGSFIAMDRIGILNDTAIKSMNHVVFYVFNPALVGYNLADTMTAERLAKLWFMPINILFTFVLGSALGWILVKITRAPPNLKGLILGACSAGNLGNMLIIILPALCEESDSPFSDIDNCSSYGLAYASLSMALGAIFIWTYVYNIVRISSTIQGVDMNGSSAPLEFSGETSENHPDSYTEPLLQSKDYSISDDNAVQLALPYVRPEEKVSIFIKVWQSLKMFGEKLNLKRVFAPSTIGVIVGFMIGLIPQVRKTLIGDNAPLRVVRDSAELVAAGAIPSITLIIGGNLLKGLKGPGMNKFIIVGIMAIRYILMPLIGIVVVKGAHYVGFVQSDSLYQFVLLIQYALPPAVNIGTITQLFKAGEKECSVIMLWTYIFASITLTLWSTFFMSIVS